MRAIEADRGSDSALVADAPENAIRIHVSQISSYQTCPRMYYFNYVLGIVPKVESPKLVFGRGIHEAIAVYYSTGSPQRAVEAYRSWLSDRQNELKGTEAAAGVLKESEEIGELLLRAYIAYAEEHDDFVAVSIEQPFSVPVWVPQDDGEFLQLEFNGVPVYHEGTVDGVVRNRYGKLWLMEHKTASSFPSSQQLRVDLQVSFYLLATQQLYDEEVCGVVYNVLRKVNPKRARTPVIHRELVSRSAYELKQAVGMLHRAVLRILTDNVYDPTPGHHCSWKCAYWQPCLCLLDGTPVEQVINELYERLEQKEVNHCEDEN